MTQVMDLPPSLGPLGLRWKHDDNMHESKFEAKIDSRTNETQFKKSKMTLNVWHIFQSQGLGNDSKPLAKCKGCKESIWQVLVSMTP